jgi:hypothetical protein
MSTSSSADPPAFGHGLLKYWSFAPGYVNLNHGSYGSTPLPVQKYCRELRLQVCLFAVREKTKRMRSGSTETTSTLAAQVENNVDRFMRRDYLPLLTEVRPAGPHSTTEQPLMLLHQSSIRRSVSHSPT